MFTHAQTIIITIGIIEKALIYTDIGDIDACMVLLSIITSLAVVSYC